MTALPWRAQRVTYVEDPANPHAVWAEVYNDEFGWRWEVHVQGVTMHGEGSDLHQCKALAEKALPLLKKVAAEVADSTGIPS